MIYILTALAFMALATATSTEKGGKEEGEGVMVSEQEHF
jgi:hypothetical protein